jgi:MoaA/NifB/PqqE/SkfB family radical SAM enzyme
MDLKNIDRSFMMVFLLEECNFSCPHCVREDEPMLPGYKLTLQQLGACLKDCQDLKTIEWVHFSGGEPTLWNEGKLDLADLLITISKAGFMPGFTTNGSDFDDYVKCNNFLKKYFNNADKKLRLFISIDTFHNNFDVDKGRAESLDNVLRCKTEMPPEKDELLDITVLVTVSKDNTSLLPNDMISHYESKGVKFNYVPLDSKGKARSLAHLCPDLGSDKPEDLGAYFPFHEKKKKDELKSTLILIGEDYYLYDYDHSIEFTQRWNKIALLGDLEEKI